jgi:small subunit ribosomal protein S3
MSRSLDVRLGSLPLSTLQANIEYGFAEAFTTYGAIGVKVWIYKGMFDKAVADEAESKAAGGKARARGRR